MPKFLIIVLLISFVYKLEAQDLSDISKVKPLTVNGGISANAVWYSTKNISSQRPPFFWVLNANLTFNVYSVAVPFSATITSQNSEFSQPFNQFGISPKYKAFTAHIGFRSMQFSEFTLSGMLFLGAGIEYAPKKSKWKAKAMFGRFAKAISIANGPDIANNDPAFERWGYAGQVGYRLSIGEINANFFKAKDNVNSIDVDTLNLTAKENFVYGLSTNLNITKKLNFSGEIAQSVYTKDVSQPTLGEDEYGYANNFRFVIAPNSSTVTNVAGTATLTYSLKSSNVGFTYRRVGPDYKSMGAVYLNNDLENYTINLGTNLFKKRMSLAGSFGVQRNNLSGQQLQSDNRIIVSANANYRLTKKINVSGTYSNFRSSSTPSATAIQDTIKFLQLTNNYGALVSYSTGNKNNTHAVSFSGNYQKADALQEGGLATVSDGSEFYNAYGSYNLGYPKLKLVVTLAMMYNRFIGGGIITDSYGPTLGITKRFWKDKIAANITGTYMDNLQNSSYQSNNVSFVYGLAYKLDKFNSVRIDGRFLTRQSAGDIRGNETQFGITYGFNF